MNREEITKQVWMCVADVVGCDNDLVESGVDASQTLEGLGLDSLDRVEILMGLEEEFDIEIPDEDCQHWITVNDVIAYVIPNLTLELMNKITPKDVAIRNGLAGLLKFYQDESVDFAQPKVPEPCNTVDKPAMNANKILKAASDCLLDRATERDQEQERSMAKCVATFNALTGHKLSEYHGWVFMALLKLSRAENCQGRNVDDFIDGAAYIALAGESKQS